MDVITGKRHRYICYSTPHTHYSIKVHTTNHNVILFGCICCCRFHYNRSLSHYFDYWQWFGLVVDGSGIKLDKSAYIRLCTVNEMVAIYQLNKWMNENLCKNWQGNVWKHGNCGSENGSKRDNADNNGNEVIIMMRRII